MVKRISNHYVNNADFFQALVDYKKLVQDAKDQNAPHPRIPDYIGECILKIANHLSFRPNFINYTYRDDMISDGIGNCIRYIDNFDPVKSQNPFAYFTQIIYFAFLNRIKEEKKQSLIKGKIIMDMPFDVFDVQSQDEGESYVNTYIDFLRNNEVYKDIVDKEEARKLKNKKPEAVLDIFEEDK
jgi:hypothetical protein